MISDAIATFFTPPKMRNAVIAANINPRMIVIPSMPDNASILVNADAEFAAWFAMNPTPYVTMIQNAMNNANLRFFNPFLM